MLDATGSIEEMVISLTIVALLGAISIETPTQKSDFEFPRSIKCTVHQAVIASVQTGVSIHFSSIGHVREWTYDGDQKYSFIYENQKVVFETRILNGGDILELLRAHTTYSIDLVNEL